MFCPGSCHTTSSPWSQCCRYDLCQKSWRFGRQTPEWKSHCSSLKGWYLLSTLALPAGRIMEYISRIFSLPRFPSGQSALKPLQGDGDGDGDGDGPYLYHSLISVSSYLVFFFRKSMSSWVRVWDTLLPFFLYFPPFPAPPGSVDNNKSEI